MTNYISNDANELIENNYFKFKSVYHWLNK